MKKQLLMTIFLILFFPVALMAHGGESGIFFLGYITLLPAFFGACDYFYIKHKLSELEITLFTIIVINYLAIISVIIVIFILLYYSITILLYNTIFSILTLITFHVISKLIIYKYYKSIGNNYLIRFGILFITEIIICTFLTYYLMLSFDL